MFYLLNQLNLTLSRIIPHFYNPKYLLIPYPDNNNKLHHNIYIYIFYLIILLLF